jgi:hypothetical protein
MHAATPLPEGCPPETAQPKAGVFFRLASRHLAVGATVVGDEWTLPYAKAKGECVGHTARCECHAHSLFLDVNDLLEARKVLNWVRQKSIASITIDETMGVLEHTPAPALGESHHDWWPHDDVQPEAVVTEAAAT